MTIQIRSSAAFLSSRQRFGALVAGAVAMPLMVVGAALAAVLCSVIWTMYVFLAGVLFIFLAIASPADGGVRTWLADGFYFAPVGLGVISAATVIGVTFLLGWYILRRFGVHRAAAVAATSIGVSLLPVAAVTAVLYGFFAASIAGHDGLYMHQSPSRELQLALIVVDVISACVIGLFVWWFIAHAFRQRRGHDGALSGAAVHL